MKIALTTVKTVVLITLLMLVAACSEGPILPRIETYKAPPIPSGDNYIKERYDYRKITGVKNPPTLTDTFICDLWKRMDTDLKLKDIAANRVSEKDVRAAIDMYAVKDSRLIVGYRSWTHTNFIKGLSKSEREKLAVEVATYMKKNGVREAQQ